MSSLHARTPPLRPIGPSETLETLTHWRTTFKSFYNKYFIKETTEWDPDAAGGYYSQAAEGRMDSREEPRT